MPEEGEPLSIPEEQNTAEGDEHAPSRREHLRSVAGVLLSGLEKIRPDSRTVSAGFLIFERDRQFPTSLLVGALASRLVIFLIPFLILVIFTIGLGTEVAGVSASDTAEVSGLPGLFAQAAADSTAANTGLRGLALVVTAFAVVWAANALGKTLRLAFAVVWQVRRRKIHRRSLVPLTVIDFVLLGMTVNGVSTQLNQPGAADNVVFLTVEFLVIAGMWLLASRILPHDLEATRWLDFLPGALLVGVGVVAMRAAMLFYLIPKWDALSDRYGDVGIVLVMLSWAYLVGFAAIASAHVNSALFYSRKAKPQQSDGERSWPLVAFLRDQWRSFRATDETEQPEA